MSTGTNGSYRQGKALPSVFKHDLLRRCIPPFGGMTGARAQARTVSGSRRPDDHGILRCRAPGPGQPPHGLPCRAFFAGPTQRGQARGPRLPAGAGHGPPRSLPARHPARLPTPGTRGHRACASPWSAAPLPPRCPGRPGGTGGLPVGGERAVVAVTGQLLCLHRPLVRGRHVRDGTALVGCGRGAGREDVQVPYNRAAGRPVGRRGDAGLLQGSVDESAAPPVRSSRQRDGCGV